MSSLLERRLDDVLATAAQETEDVGAVVAGEIGQLRRRMAAPTSLVVTGRRGVPLGRLAARCEGDEVRVVEVPGPGPSQPDQGRGHLDSTGIPQLDLATAILVVAHERLSREDLTTFEWVGSRGIPVLRRGLVVVDPAPDPPEGTRPSWAATAAVIEDDWSEADHARSVLIHFARISTLLGVSTAAERIAGSGVSEWHARFAAALEQLALSRAAHALTELRHLDLVVSGRARLPADLHSELVDGYLGRGARGLYSTPPETVDVFDDRLRRWQERVSQLAPTEAAVARTFLETTRIRKTIVETSPATGDAS